jgi:hypothetical protein
MRRKKIFSTCTTQHAVECADTAEAMREFENSIRLYRRSHGGVGGACAPPAANVQFSIVVH